MKSTNRRNSYHTIPIESRRELAERVIHQDEPLKVVAEDLGINISTCKAILKVYLNEGRLGKKEKRNKVIAVYHTVSFIEETAEGSTEILEPKLEEWKFAFERGDDYEEPMLKEAESKAEALAEEVVFPPLSQETSPQQSPASASMPMQFTFLNGGFFPMFPQMNQDSLNGDFIFPNSK